MTDAKDSCLGAAGGKSEERGARERLRRAVIEGVLIDETERQVGREIDN